MSISYNSNGTITLTANYKLDGGGNLVTETLETGLSELEIGNDIIAFFADDLPPPTTQDQVMPNIASGLGISEADCAAFFNGTMPTNGYAHPITPHAAPV